MSLSQSASTAGAQDKACHGQISIDGVWQQFLLAWAAKSGSRHDVI